MKKLCQKNHRAGKSCGMQHDKKLKTLKLAGVFRHKCLETPIEIRVSISITVGYRVAESMNTQHSALRTTPANTRGASSKSAAASRDTKISE
jgi:hypothetical protein